jgi:hypothetical protein
MAALTTALVATAAVGAAGSIYSANKQTKAAKNAANVQKQSQDEALAFQQRARDEAKQILSKYSTEGDAARGRQNAFLGLNKPRASQPQAAAPMGYAGALGTPAGMRQVRGRYGPNGPMGEFSTLGQIEGGPIEMGQPGMMSPGADPTKTDAETQEEAWAAYEQTPWAKIGTMEAGKARDDFLTMAGAQGSALSGRTARGMSEVAEEAKLRNFMGYYGALGDVTERGFSADSGIASGGQQFADRAAGIKLEGGRTSADFYQQKGQNQANAANDLASWIGWGMGQMPGGGTAGGTGGGSGPSSIGGGALQTRPYRAGGLRSRIG